MAVYVPLFNSTDCSPEFRNNAPLWFYILAEAQQQFVNDETPIRLGPVGGRIIGETLVGLMWNNPKSFLRIHPGFQPDPALCGASGIFQMAGLLKQAILS